MPAAGNKIVDEATTVDLIRAFATASDDQQDAHNAVSSSQAALAGGWRGAASGRFTDGLGEWMQGLMKVRQGLQMINDSMVQFSKQTSSTEDDNLALAVQGEVSASWT